ncbi:ABC transporter permease [Alteromonas gracilis]
MGLARIAVRRLRSAPARPLAYALVVAVVTALGVGLAAHLDSGLTRGVRAGLEQAVAVDSVRALSTRWDAGEAGLEQRRLGDRLVSAAVGPAGGDVRAEVRAEVRSSARDLATPSGPRTAVLGDLGDTAGLRLSAGDWPTAPDVVAVRDDLDVSVGDRLVEGERSWTVGALWRPVDPAAARWSLDPAYRPDAALEPGAPAGAALVLVDDEALATDPVRPFLRWSITAAPTLTAAEAPRLAEALAGLEPRLGEQVAPSGLVAEGRLPQTLDRLDAVARAVAPLFPVALALLGVGCLLVLGQLARLQAASRIGELSLLRARGASLPQIAGLAAVEVALTCLPAATLGGTGGLLLARSLPGGQAAPVPWVTVGALGAGVVLLALVLAAGALAAAAHRALGRTTGESTGRASGSLLRVAALILLGIVAVASVVRLQQRSARGEAADPFLALAPATALLLPAVIVLVGLGAVTAGVAVLVARWDAGLLLPLAARQVARRLPLLAAPAIALTLTVGATLLASGYAATSASSQQAALRAQVGPDVRIAAAGGIASPPLSPAETAGIAEALGGGGVGAALTRSARLGEADDVSLLAAPGQVLPPGPVAPRDARTGLALPATDGALPDAGPDLRVALDVRVAGRSRVPATVRVDASLQGADGVLRPLRSAPVALPLNASGARSAVALDWPADLTDDLRAGRVRLCALDVLLGSPATGSLGSRVEVTGLELGGTAVPLGAGWRVLTLGEGAATALDQAPGWEGTLDPVPGGQLRRLLPPGTPDLTEAPLAVVVDRALADVLAVGVGDEVDALLEGSGRPLRVRVDSIVDTVASVGEGRAVLADLGDLQQRMLQRTGSVPDPDELWAMLPGADPEEVQAAAERVRRALAADVAVTTASPSVPARQIAPAAEALWAGAWGVGLLAVLAFAVAGLAALDVRRRELPVLQGLGLDARAQARGRVLEQLIVVATALAAGVLTGVLAAALVVRPLARTVVPDLPAVLATPWRWDLASAGLLLAGVLAGIALVTLAHALVVARQVAATLLRGSTL